MTDSDQTTPGSCLAQRQEHHIIIVRNYSNCSCIEIMDISKFRAGDGNNLINLDIGYFDTQDSQ
jgi:hypothetical protein